MNTGYLDANGGYGRMKKASASATGRTMPRRKHILVVDDEPIHRESLTELLLAEGYDVTTCDRAIDALNQMRARNPFDLVISDVVMPQMDGLEFMAGVRALPRPIPVVLVTGHDGAVENILASGAIALLKPYSVLTLQGVLSEQLSHN
jgi:CheY-like chemotaxis protein